MNLLSNAIKYTSQGYVKLTAKIDVNNKSKVSFIIEDTGTGISQENLPNIFKQFNKVKDFRSMNKHGCGLGLTISKNISKALGGDIEVKSVFGKGS